MLVVVLIAVMSVVILQNTVTDALFRRKVIGRMWAQYKSKYNKFYESVSDDHHRSLHV